MKSLTLQDLLDKQHALQIEMGMPIPETEEGAVMHILAAQVELVEVLSELNWKPWKKTKKEVNRSDVTTEIVDVFQFLANIANSLGITADELTDAYERKLKINYERNKNGY